MNTGVYHKHDTTMDTATEPKFKMKASEGKQHSNGAQQIGMRQRNFEEESLGREDMCIEYSLRSEQGKDEHSNSREA